MDQRQIENALQKHMIAVRAIAATFCATVVLYVGVAWLLLRFSMREPLLELSRTVIYSVASAQLVVLLAGYLVSRAILQQTVSAPAPRPLDGAPARADELLVRYLKAVVIAAALRELVSIVGLVLTILTGELIWVVLLGSVALASMLIHWPRREGIEDWLLLHRGRA